MANHMRMTSLNLEAKKCFSHSLTGSYAPFAEYQRVRVAFRHSQTSKQIIVPYSLLQDLLCRLLGTSASAVLGIVGGREGGGEGNDVADGEVCGIDMGFRVCVDSVVSSLSLCLGV